MMIVEIDWNVLMWGFENRMSDRIPCYRSWNHVL